MRHSLLKHGTEFVPNQLPEDYSEFAWHRFGAMWAYQNDLSTNLYFSVANTEIPVPQVIKDCEFCKTWTLEYTQIKSVKRKSYDWVYLLPDNGCVEISHREGGQVSGRIFVDTEAQAMEIYGVLNKLFPPEKTDLKPAAIPIKFWNLSNDGPVSRNRKINALDWDEIGVNYPPKVSKEIDTLMRIHPPLDGGKIILWHGPPGTGKSSAIRSLSQAWFPWCDTAYIVDPERFFGDSGYMMEVLLNTTTTDYDWDYPEDEDDEEDEVERNMILKGEDRWRVLLLEDADEFIKIDAKDRTGQALSRLLNLGDGIIGQGLNFLTLITTNEKLDGVHSAVSREGRSLANLDFAAFSQAEAKAWFKNKTGTELNTAKHDETNKKMSPATDWTLAQLYEAVRGVNQIKTEEEDVSYGGIYL